MLYATARPKGYRVRKGICIPQNKVIVACYFLQPHFIDLAIWIRHFPKFATFLEGDATFQRSERLAVLNFHTLKSHGGNNPQAPRTIFGPFFGVPVTRFARPRDRKVTTSVWVYAPLETKCSLLATFCSRILLIWQYGSVIFRNSQLLFSTLTL
jgi:hypothetical protein